MKPIVRAAAAVVLVAAGVSTAPEAEAQRRPQPQLLLSVSVGATSDVTLYNRFAQPLAQIENPFATDTLALGRRLSPGIVAGASATYFPSPSLGLSGEITFLGFGLDDACTITITDPLPGTGLSANEQTCDDIANKSGSGSTFAFYAGGLYRFLPGGGIQPYLRAQAGITVRNGSTVEVAGRFLDTTGRPFDRLVIGDPDPGALDPSASFGIGFMLPFAPGYQARLELRDHLLYVTRATAPANALAQAPTERRLEHSLGIVIMLDIVLEQRRGRRY